MNLAGTRALDRLAHGHALMLMCACAAILSLGLSPRNNWAPLDWRSTTTLFNENDIDAKLQAAATAALGQREGTIIIVDPQTGRIRAVVNPQTAFRESVMPGSTMKPFTALAALRAGLIDPNSRSVCPGRFTGRDFSVACVHPDHLPPFTPAQAIAYSCNYYFGTLGERLGRDKLIETLRPFGLGQATGVNTDEQEARGTIQPCETGNIAKVRFSKTDGGEQEVDCDAREAIGESDHIQVTPIQLLDAYTALVNNGHLFQPGMGSASDFRPVERARIAIAPPHRAIITEGMRGAVRFGTAKGAHLDSLALNIFGKTGTSLPAKGFRPNGWFVGFAGPVRNSGSDLTTPNGDPDPSDVNLAVLVFLERSHGAEAAAMSRTVFETFANETNNGQRSEAETRPGNAGQKPLSVLGSAATIRVHLVHDNVTQELSLEDYVLGVVRAEGSMESEPDALKALAVAVRTFALKNRGRHAKDGYDFCSTTHCQRFIGGSSTAAMIDAVRSTEGEVLVDDRGQLVDAYFGASCGGMTANINELWGVNPSAYLRGIRDEYCVTGPHANWTDVISRADLLRALQSDARTNVGGKLDQIAVSRRDETGRAEFIALEGEHRKIVRGWDFKIIVGRILGWNVLKSSRFEVSRSGSNFIFRGSGFGHGLGLCQEGAHVMAQRGAAYQRILEKYFPGTSVRKEDRVARSLSGGERWDRRVWKADVLLGTPRLNHQIAASLQPRSGEIFIAQKLVITGKLRRSAMLSPEDKGARTHHAPTELGNLLDAPDYKYFVPTGLGPNQRFLTISSEHFRVTYPAGVDRRDADSVLTTLENARSDFQRRVVSASISIGPIPSLEIHINDSTGDFVGRTGQPWWAAAATRGNKIELQPVGLLKRRGVLETTLRHELAHVFIDAASHNRAPRWLEEGFAIYLAGEGATISRYAPRARMTTDELERKLERPGSQQEMRALYALAYREVSELIQSEGERQVWLRLAK